MYIAIHFLLDLTETNIPTVKIVAKGEDRDKVMAQMLQAYSAYVGWNSYDEFTTECPDVVRQIEKDGYAAVDFEDSQIDFWTVKEV